MVPGQLLYFLPSTELVNIYKIIQISSKKKKRNDKETSAIQKPCMRI